MTDPIYCNWCGKPSDEVRKMIAGQNGLTGHNVFICNECVVLCAAIVSEQDDHFTEEVAAMRAYIASQRTKDSD
jgi:ATP-dependent Clp protease ATP-binding subunit ClpX